MFTNLKWWTRRESNSRPQ